MRAIDFHVHPPTKEWIEGSMQPYRASAERYFNAKVELATMDEIASLYKSLDIVAVLLGWDATTSTGRPRLSNDDVAAAAAAHKGTFIPFAGIDPHRGAEAIDELRRAVVELKMKGAKFHPSLQAFDPSNPSYFDLWAAAEDLGVPLIFHTGTSGIGAGEPGGQGIRIDLARPILLDPVAAEFPQLKIVMAHFGWPWHLEAMAMALHKSNVFLDVSGWAPRFLPPEVVRDMGGRLSRQFLWGSDYPFLHPSRCLEEFDKISMKADARDRVLFGNAQRIFGMPKTALAASSDV